jgi:hypothetical protein
VTAESLTGVVFVDYSFQVEEEKNEDIDQSFLSQFCFLKEQTEMRANAYANMSKIFYAYRKSEFDRLQLLYTLNLYQVNEIALDRNQNVKNDRRIRI